MRLVVFGRPVLDGETQWVRPKTAVKDWARILMDGVEIDNPLGGKVAVRHQENSSVVQEEGESVP